MNVNVLNVKQYKVSLQYSHCMFCDVSGKPTDQRHPMLQRILDLQDDGNQVQMNWEDCKVCLDHGAPENTKVIVKCELEIPYEVG